MSDAFRQSGEEPDAGGKLRTVTFAGPAGRLEGLWKEPSGPRVGSAVFAHPHSLHGGTMHSKVVSRAAQAFSSAGFATLRFNFRGVGLSEGRYDAGRGETEDFRAAADETERLGGLPILAGGFSFGSAVALRAIAGDSRVLAFVGIGLAVATESGAGLGRPRVPALFVVGERDVFGPPARLRQFVGGSGEIVEISGADHFLEGKLVELAAAIRRFLATLPVAVGKA
ncbi:MAG: alpha/beta hydrolase [Thermoanaerobaculia bacterium]